MTRKICLKVGQPHFAWMHFSLKSCADILTAELSLTSAGWQDILKKIQHKALKKIVDVKKFILYTYSAESVLNSCRYPVQVGSGSSLICNFFVPVTCTGGIRIRKNLWLIRISILSRQVKNHARFGDPDPGDFVISSYRYPVQVVSGSGQICII